MEKINLFSNRRIIIGVTGSIACYKAVDLASKLTQAGAQVDVVLTDAAQRFVAPLTFQSVTGRPVYTDMWQGDTAGGLQTHIAHVGLGEGADLIAVAPATAHTLAKLANGMADNLLTVTALAARCPLMIAPAMDGSMYNHPAVRANVETLKARGAYWVEPEEGRFASGLSGKGRLPDTHALMGHMRRILGRERSLKGRHIVVTAGGTREPLDPVRYLTNHSSGKQGYAIAQAALDTGASVTLISSTDALPVPVGAEFVAVDTAQNMLDAVLSHCQDADALVMAAAVADFRPAAQSAQKIKKDQAQNALELAPNPDILMKVRERRTEIGGPKVIVGFAAETENLRENALNKLHRKGMNLMVANDVSAKDAGFGTDNNRVILIDESGATTEHDLMSKAAVGEMICQRIASKLA